MSRHKYERDTGKLQAEVDELKAENEGYKALRDEFEQWKSSQEAEKSEKALKDAGCIDVKAASARLPEFDGDISKLKEECPYLFASTDNTKSTGGNPKGKPGGDGTAKTIRDGLKMRKEFDYQSECHCSKTPGTTCRARCPFDYQSECHCSKTAPWRGARPPRFDYQSECHLYVVTSKST